ncbi:MAG: hypothetical protein O7G85_14285 [Planctomycetota bacterium]|nr:hypothetical protein [Planctomycetota bacterium]
MPANRSRTTRWRRCLEQVHQRNGSLEIAISRDYDEGSEGQHLIWRVRLLDLSESEVVVEQPMTLGQLIKIRQGIELVAIITIGQNRWMFTTTNLGDVDYQLNANKKVPAMRMVLPEKVERCQRRNYYRVETAALRLPEVEMWPLLDPKSVVIAERANELCILENSNSGMAVDEALKPQLDEVMPEVGPRFNASLVNIGGGGVGLNIDPEDGYNLSRHKLFWIRITLSPELEHPICLTGKVVHTHMESNLSTYAGVSFDFSFNPDHQRFVSDQICKYIAVQQRNQLRRESEREDERISA